MEPSSPAPARARYTADLWMIHTKADGRQQREHLVINVDGSGAVPFMFNTVRSALPQLDPRQGDIARRSSSPDRCACGRAPTVSSTSISTRSRSCSASTIPRVRRP
jgi:hypothetical protein